MQHVVDETGLAFANANWLVLRFEELALLKEITGKQCKRPFAYQPYFDMFAEGELSETTSG